MVSLCVLAVIANTFILTISRWIPSRLFKLPLKLTLSLAAADAWTSTVIAVGLVAHSYAPFVLGLKKPSWYDCASYGLEALRLGGMLTSVLHLLALALTQYFAANHPHLYKTWLVGCRLRLIHGLIIFLWLAPPSLFFIIFGAYSHRTFLRVKNASVNGAGILHSPTKSCNADFLDTLGVRVLVFLIVSLPIAVMTIVYIKIFFVLFTLRRDSACDVPDQTISSCTRCRFQNRIRRCTRRVVTTLWTVLTFLAGWIPAATLFALTCSECLYPYKRIRKNYPAAFFALMVTGNLLMISKGLVNPFIYAVRIPEIRDAIKLLLRHTSNGRGSRRESAVSTTGTRRRLSEGDTLIRNFDEMVHREMSTEVTSPKLFIRKKSEAKIYGSMRVIG